MTTSVDEFPCVNVYTLMAPFVPAGTMAAFAKTLPLAEFSVETIGWDEPVAQAVK